MIALNYVMLVTFLCLLVTGGHNGENTANSTWSNNWNLNSYESI